MRVLDPSRSLALALLALCVGHLACGSSSSDLAVTAPTPTKLTLSCTVAPTSGVVPLTVGVGVTVAPTPVSLDIQYGDGTSSNNPNALHVYTVAGSYTLVVHATAGTQTASCQGNVTAQAPPPKPPNRPPDVKFRTNPNPASGPAPLTVSFNMCGTTDPDNDLMTFHFDFGDGSHANSSLCRHDHTFAKGTYNTETCVDDGVAAHETCRQATVRAE